MNAVQTAPQPTTAPTAHRTPVVVVGVDGSAAADRALAFAVAEAQLRHATLRIVASHEPIILSAGYAGAWTPVPYDVGLRQVTVTHAAEAEAAVARLTCDAPVTVEVRVVDGHASDALLAASADADLLVVGSRGAGALTRLLTGSTCTEVVHHAHVPVVVVPAQVAPAADGGPARRR